MANINKVALLNNGKVVGAGRNKDNSNLAPIEATTTASRSYLVGDYLMLQGEFYKVISAISIGDTLTVGTNIQATSIGDEIVDVKDRVTELEKEHILEFDINNVAITTTWGGIYSSSEVSLSISSLGLSVAPKVVSLLYIDQTGGVAFPIFSRINTSTLAIYLVRGSSATVAGKIEAILRY